jgi:superfamily II DNA/RNA helicase
MTGLQWKHHQENRDIVAQIVRKWRRFKFLSEADQRRLMIALQNMRMSCDSTYLLDHKTDFGIKADELATLLEEIFEQPDSKVVVFSQWLRMHELLVRRMQDRDWEHVLFHGGVPGQQRKGLVDRFREEDRCRTFLATDAGGVGLNLQQANVVVNMDLPWNPAVLEQRIGRVHRLGQKQPVRVVNFVAQGTIEEGMLSVIKFKKSLFAGVLDGGEKEVFLGGNRLNRFMETVEKASSAIPEPAIADPASTQEANGEPLAAETDQGPATTAPAAQTQSTSLAGLLQTGLKLLEELALASRSASSSRTDHSQGESAGRNSNTSHGLAASWIGRDEQTGQSFLKLPMPKPEVLDQALQAIGALLEGWSGPLA